MKAILRSINNFSCKLKQSNNLKYNISPKIRSNKFKNISGNSNIVIEDALNKNLKDYRVYGNTYQNSTSGKNLNIYPYNGHTLANGITFTLNADGTLIIDGQNNNKGNSAFYFFSNSSNPRILEAGTYYFIPPSNTHVQYVIYDGINYYNFKSVNNYHRTFQTSISAKAMYIQVSKGSSAIFNGLKVYPMLSTTVVTEDDYEPYTGGQPSPNPDYPQKIVSCGDRTKNLLNVSNEYSVTTWQEIDVNLQPGDYIVNCTDASTNVESGNTSLMNFYHSDNTYDQSYLNRVDKVGTVTITAETTKVRIYSGGSYAVSNGKTTILTNLMIRKSNISDGTYEPYGYKIPFNVRSENLFDIDTISNIGGGTNNNGIITSTTRSTSGTINLNFKFSDILVKAGETLYFSADIKLNNDSIGTFSTINDNVHAGATKIIYPTLNNKYQRYQTSYTYSNDETVKSMLIQIGNLLGSFEVSNIMISKDDSIIYKPYYNETTNIYLNEPLRGIGDYVDILDFKNGKIVRQIYEYKITGNEPNYDKDHGEHLFRIRSLFLNNTFITGYGLSNMYRYNPIQSGINAHTNDGEFALQYDRGYSHLFIKNNSYSTVETFKTYLQNLYNNHTPVIINYPLETPTEEDIELPNINLIEGKNIISIGTEVQGVFETEYYSKEIIDISNYKYNLRKVED